MDTEPDKKPIQHDTRMLTAPKQALNLIIRGEAGKDAVTPNKDK